MKKPTTTTENPLTTDGLPWRIIVTAYHDGSHTAAIQYPHVWRGQIEWNYWKRQPSMPVPGLPGPDPHRAPTAEAAIEAMLAHIPKSQPYEVIHQ